MNRVTAVPAYGRDYTNQTSVMKDWDAGKDFQVQPSGQYISRAEAEEHGITVNVRYSNLRKVMQVT